MTDAVDNDTFPLIDFTISVIGFQNASKPSWKNAHNPAIRCTNNVLEQTAGTKQKQFNGFHLSIKK